MTLLFVQEFSVCKYSGWKRRTCQLGGFYGEQYLSDSDTYLRNNHTTTRKKKLNLLDLNCKFGKKAGNIILQFQVQISIDDHLYCSSSLAQCSPFIYITHMSSFITRGPCPALHTKFLDSAPKLKWLAMLKRTTNHNLKVIFRISSVFHRHFRTHSTVWLNFSKKNH